MIPKLSSLPWTQRGPERQRDLRGRRAGRGARDQACRGCGSPEPAPPQTDRDNRQGTGRQAPAAHCPGLCSMATAPQLLAWPCPYRLRPCQPLPQPGTHRCPAPQQPSFCPSISFRLTKRTQRWLRLMLTGPRRWVRGTLGPLQRAVCWFLSNHGDPWAGAAQGATCRGHPRLDPHPLPGGLLAAAKGRRRSWGQSRLLTRAARPLPGLWVRRVKGSRPMRGQPGRAGSSDLQALAQRRQREEEGQAPLVRGRLPGEAARPPPPAPGGAGLGSVASGT